MKICPDCAFANEERFPTCVWCNTVLASVKSTPAADPAHPEHARRRLAGERHSYRRAQLCFSVACYAAILTLLAAVPGMIFDRYVLGCVFSGAAVVGLAMVRGYLGPFSAMFLQGVVTGAIIGAFGLVGLLTAFTLLGNILLPAVFHQWIDLIETGYG